MTQWTQPICGKCYAEREPDREPVKVIDADIEICCDCGAETQEGIYVRADPTTVNYPAKED